MTIKVAIDALDQALADFDSAFLITVGSDGRAKVVGADIAVEGDVVVMRNGSAGTARNLAGNPAVTLLCPPREHHGMALLIDGQGAPDGDGFRITPEHAILHRPASHSDDPQSPNDCGNDCRPVG